MTTNAQPEELAGKLNAIAQDLITAKNNLLQAEAAETAARHATTSARNHLNGLLKKSDELRAAFDLAIAKGVSK